MTVGLEAEAPNCDGDRNAPIWALSVITDPLDEEWWPKAKTLGEGMTFGAAVKMARELGYSSIPIGLDSWPDED